MPQRENDRDRDSEPQVLASGAPGAEQLDEIQEAIVDFEMGKMGKIEI